MERAQRQQATTCTASQTVNIITQGWIVIGLDGGLDCVTTNFQQPFKVKGQSSRSQYNVTY